ncbi:methylthioribulose 1-phosphate dehydratase [Thiocapsa roseopersicina]|uniref:Methylthioribulose-1-phosphate dehydratase n=1 Tax=Thiocapsa roseopersicina TaxID=1058 RepID=A0A1H2TKD4_THIRO|nr:methylthioribulose 1-phosphate dehydratase [Thiocapsa roseopersicina]SDW43699.1 methylthioribulose-1-phosphate dehydratase [Thiocapsa roseopersicina]
MVDPEVFKQRAAELIGVGHFCFSRGWLPATSGNLSARLDASRIAITVSGRHKGELDASGIMAMDVDGTILTAGCRPSAETELHLMLYRRDPSIGAVLHTHSVNATVLSRLAGDALTLSDYEVLKALPGIETHETRLALPVFANDQDIVRLAVEVERALERMPDLPGYLIAGHGLYTWGSNVADARRRIEAFEFLLECETLTRSMTR